MDESAADFYAKTVPPTTDEEIAVLLAAARAKRRRSRVIGLVGLALVFGVALVIAGSVLGPGIGLVIAGALGLCWVFLYFVIRRADATTPTEQSIMLTKMQASIHGGAAWTDGPETRRRH